MSAPPQARRCSPSGTAATIAPTITAHSRIASPPTRKRAKRNITIAAAAAASPRYAAQRSIAKPVEKCHSPARVPSPAAPSSSAATIATHSGMRRCVSGLLIEKVIDRAVDELVHVRGPATRYDLGDL